jgi:hypothetical protein
LCLLCLSDDVVSPFLPPHLGPDVRRCSAIALRLGGAFEFFGLKPSNVPTVRKGRVLHTSLSRVRHAHGGGFAGSEV